MWLKNINDSYIRSGCHINPAVTVGMLVAGKIDHVKALLYILFQCVGAVVGAGLLKVKQNS